MPRRIPPKLHFIFCEDNFYDHTSRNMARWMFNNPKYKVFVWCTPGNLREVVRRLDTVLTGLPEHDRMAQVEKETGRAGFGGSVGKCKVFDEDVGHGAKVVASYGYGGHFRGQITVRPITMLPERMLLRELYEYTAGHLGGKALEDAVALWVLHCFGGIYIDNTVRPQEAPLPTFIHTDRGILFPRYNNHGVALTTGIIAGAQGAEVLEEIAEYLLRNAHDPEPIGPDIIDVKLSKTGGSSRMRDDMVLMSRDALRSASWGKEVREGLTGAVSMERLDVERGALGPEYAKKKGFFASLRSFKDKFKRTPPPVDIAEIEANTRHWQAHHKEYTGMYINKPRDLADQRLYLELMHYWMAQQEMAGEGHMLQFDFSHQTGYFFSFNKENRRLIPPVLFDPKWVP